MGAQPRRRCAGWPLDGRDCLLREKDAKAKTKEEEDRPRGAAGGDINLESSQAHWLRGRAM